MEHNLLNGKTILSNTDSGGFWMVAKITAGTIFALVILFLSGVFVWAQQYEDRIPPNTVLAGVDVGGMDPESVRQSFQEKIDTILTKGATISVDDETRTLGLVSLSTNDPVENVTFELEEAIETFMSLHDDNVVVDTFAMFASIFRTTNTEIPVNVEEARIQEDVLILFPEHETLSEPSAFSISRNGTLWSIDINDGSPGTEFDWEPFFQTLSDNLKELDLQQIELTLSDIHPKQFTDDEKHELASKAATALQSAPHELYYEDQIWEISGDELATLLAPNDDLSLGLVDESFFVWIETIKEDVNQEARDARLTIENGRVVDFVESLEGRALDEERLKEDLLSMLAATQEAPMDPIELVVEVTQPSITTGDVNDLGITQVLGIGTSSYYGSPWNRRMNIQNGVDLLDGLLIAPGETFSLVEALSPFTLENGYLPELVIKGDKIEPEIGGGLCQIGTTTFRATMNSGLPVVERSNHSLVVSYYNDATNGNPGTDATIYDPAPDYKFMNDTDDYVLFRAENLTETSELQFSFWGTSDGRIGSYTPPVVSRWIPVGETQNIETLDLEPGEEECQSSHIGADASFVYTIERADGEVEETVYESHYRPLPRICLVGVEELSDETDAEEDFEESEEEETASEETTEEELSEDTQETDT